MGEKLLINQTASIFTAGEFKSFARIGNTADDTLIVSGIIPAAHRWAEIALNRDVMSKQWQYTLEGGQDIIDLPRGPVISIDEVKYYDSFESTGQLLTESSDFRLAGDCLYHNDDYWDKMRGGDGYTIKYTAGMFTGSEDSTIYNSIRIAMMKFAYWLYENREMYVSGYSEGFTVSYDKNSVPPEITAMLRGETEIYL